jgi:hypothetical protein
MKKSESQVKVMTRDAVTVLISNTVRFALLTFLAEKRGILGINTLGLVLRDHKREKNCNGKR